MKPELFVRVFAADLSDCREWKNHPWDGAYTKQSRTWNAKFLLFQGTSHACFIQATKNQSSWCNIHKKQTRLAVVTFQWWTASHLRVWQYVQTTFACPCPGWATSEIRHTKNLKGRETLGTWDSDGWLGHVMGCHTMSNMLHQNKIEKNLLSWMISDKPGWWS